MSETGLTAEQARAFADAWVDAWNRHDLDGILAHYAEDVVLTSPVAAALLGDPEGTVRGRSALRAYFQRGLAAFPQLTFTLHDVLRGLHSVVLYYTNQRGTKTAEFMELRADGRVTRVVANYSS